MKVAVVGAGLAGLAAGCALSNAGHSVKLFERNVAPLLLNQVPAFAPVRTIFGTLTIPGCISVRFM